MIKRNRSLRSVSKSHDFCSQKLINNRNVIQNYFKRSRDEVKDIIKKHQNESKQTVIKLNKIKQDLLKDEIKRKRCLSINDLMK